VHIALSDGTHFDKKFNLLEVTKTHRQERRRKKKENLDKQQKNAYRNVIVDCAGEVRLLDHDEEGRTVARETRADELGQTRTSELKEKQPVS
jgi:hypothetical protein